MTIPTVRSPAVTACADDVIGRGLALHAEGAQTFLEALREFHGSFATLKPGPHPRLKRAPLDGASLDAAKKSLLAALEQFGERTRGTGAYLTLTAKAALQAEMGWLLASTEAQAPFLSPNVWV